MGFSHEQDGRFYKHVVGVSFSNSQLITFECGFLGVMKAKVTVLKAFKKSLCLCTVSLAGKALSVRDWKPNACKQVSLSSCHLRIKVNNV